MFVIREGLYAHPVYLVNNLETNVNSKTKIRIKSTASGAVWIITVCRIRFYIYFSMFCARQLD